MSSDLTGSVTWIGTIMSLVALALTYREARRAMTAAEAASAAVRSLTRVNSVGHMAYSYSQIELVKQLVQNEYLPPAQSVFHSVKRFITAGCRAAGNDQTSREKVEQAMRNIAVVDLQLSYGIARDERFSSLKTVRALTGLGSFLGQLESEFSASEGGKAHENNR